MGSLVYSSTASRQALSPGRQLVALLAWSLGIFLVSFAFVVLRPEDFDWAIWVPAVGIAVGVCLWTPRKWLVPVMSLITIAFFAAHFAAGRELPVAIVIALSNIIEIAVAHGILRGRSDVLPQLVRITDLATLVVAAVAGVLARIVFGGLALSALYGWDVGLEFATIGAFAHLGGLLAVTPFFFNFGRSRSTVSRAEIVAQGVSVFGTLAVVAATATMGLPLTFLILGPLVWGAARWGGRQFIVQYLIVITLVASVSIGGASMIDVSGIPLELGGFTVQLFVLFTTIVVLSVLALATANRRLLRLSESAIAVSLTGFAFLREDEKGWTLEARNDSARIVLGEGTIDLRQAFTPESVRWLEAVGTRFANSADTMGGVERLTTTSGRVLQSTLSPLVDMSRDRRGSGSRQYSLQFTDITDSLLLEEAQENERRRAGEVQQALLPTVLPQISGWHVAAACRPSRDVGGDFYLWNVDDDELTVSLGDIMGKGLAAGVMAASVQMAVSLHEPFVDPGLTLGNIAKAVAADMERAGTFATLFFARIDTTNGTLRYADAGHGLAMIVDRDGAVRRLSSHGIPIGVLPDSVWATETSQIEPGSTLLLVSDGVLDAFDDGWAALDQIGVISAESSSASDVVDQIAALAGGPNITDDLTVVVVRRD